jgi:hypothetical protein
MNVATAKRTSAVAFFAIENVISDHLAQSPSVPLPLVKRRDIA